MNYLQWDYQNCRGVKGVGGTGRKEQKKNMKMEELKNGNSRSKLKTNTAYGSPLDLLKRVDNSTYATTLYHYTLPLHWSSALHKLQLHLTKIK